MSEIIKNRKIAEIVKLNTNEVSMYLKTKEGNFTNQELLDLIDNYSMDDFLPNAIYLHLFEVFNNSLGSANNANDLSSLVNSLDESLRRISVQNFDSYNLLKNLLSQALVNLGEFFRSEIDDAKSLSEIKIIEQKYPRLRINDISYAQKVYEKLCRNIIKDCHNPDELDEFINHDIASISSYADDRYSELMSNMVNDTFAIEKKVDVLKSIKIGTSLYYNLLVSIVNSAIAEIRESDSVDKIKEVLELLDELPFDKHAISYEAIIKLNQLMK